MERIELVAARRGSRGLPSVGFSCCVRRATSQCMGNKLARPRVVLQTPGFAVPATTV